MAVRQTCNCGGRARRHRGPIVPLFLAKPAASRLRRATGPPQTVHPALVNQMHRFAARRLAWNLGLADDRLTKNFELTRGVLPQLITRAVVASDDEILPRLEVEAERSIMPGRRPRLLPGR